MMETQRPFAKTSWKTTVTAITISPELMKLPSSKVRFWSWTSSSELNVTGMKKCLKLIKFSAAVAEYIAKGYIINTGTMNGSQGEVAHVDLTNDSEIIRVVLMYNFATWPEKEYTIIVGRTQPNAIPNLRTNEAETIWNNKLEVISSMTYAEKEVGPREYEYRKVV